MVLNRSGSASCIRLSTPGFAREWGIGALIGVGLYTACAVTLMLLGMYKIEGLNPASFLLPTSSPPSSRASSRGAVADPGLLKATIEGPDFLTGGSFGMEESIFALVYCTTAGVILLFIAIRRGHMLPAVWNR